MSKRSWLWDVVIGLFLSLFVVGCYLLPPLLPFLESLELKSYDLRSSLRQTGEPSNEIILVAIDDSSLGQIGRWPWPRWRVAGLVDKLASAQPKVIGLNILFSEEESNEGLLEIQKLQAQYEAFVSSRNIVEKGVAFSAEFSSAAVRLDTDSKLLASIQAAGNVILPMSFSLGGLQGAKPEPLPPAVSSSVVTYAVVQGVQESEMPDGSKATYPIVRLAEVAAGVGHVNVYPDLDGTSRREIPVIRYADGYYPSYAVRLILAHMGMPTADAVFTPGMRFQAGKLDIPLDSSNGMLVSFAGPEGTFRSYTYQDVMNDKVSMDAFKGKIVIIGLTAQGVGTLYVTPAAPLMPSIELTANVIDSILNRRFLTRPPWAAQLELGLLGLIALFLMVGFPRLKALWGNLIALVLLIVIPVAGSFLFLEGYWIKVTYPMALLLAGGLVTIARRLVGTEKGKELVEASAIEQARMLGLSFQGQGMLDMAFDKFRQCPIDDNVKDALYNLALDFERKRQYAKAVSVMEHIAAKDPAYKDIAEKMKVLKAASEGAVFGGVGQSKKEGTVLITGGATKPTLGRYEIEKELGRGAMGIVYLGKDPKINRMVAIKTMMMEEGTDAAAAKEIKERFFREAESAGTLNHPNIIRIFDAGEESDVCYIAMELLDGVDLTQFAAKDKLLSPVQAMEYVALVADALDFAHAQGIVHRDIKPANIMLLKDGTIRVADFGIARITASSKTATGTVMGTPSYMSPEQVAGKKVDGRSDLFSLTVALYEFLTGEKPFKGGEGIGTLLFQIANDPHPDILKVRPELPPGASAIIDKGLAKDPAKRYARGSQMSKDLRALVEAVKSGKPMAPSAPDAGPAVVPPLPRPEAPATLTVEPLPVPAPEPVVEAAPVVEDAPAVEPAPAADAPLEAPVVEAPALAAEPSAEVSGPKIRLEPIAAGPETAPLPAADAADGDLPLAPVRGRISLNAPGAVQEAAPTTPLSSLAAEVPPAEASVVEAPAEAPAEALASAVEPLADSSASDKTIVMAPGAAPLISPEMVSSPAPEPVVEPLAEITASVEPIVELQAPAPEPGVETAAVVEAPPEAPAEAPASAVEPLADSSASDKTIVMAPGMVPLISPEMVSSPAPEPVVEPLAEITASVEPIVELQA
ncbi:MAG: CHASE2 domain-containing protein, partial [Elusimicrobiota bacterium]